MQRALKEAQKAQKRGEVPVGCVIVKDGKIIGRGRNTREYGKNALGHAELAAIRQACRKNHSWRLEDCDLYVTLEPCPMCAGAILQARMHAVYFGAYDQKAGAAGSVFNLFSDYTFNHTVELCGGVLEETCASMLSGFFRKLRTKKKQKR